MMVVELARRSLVGLGFTALFTFAALSAMVLQDLQAPVSIIWKNMLGSMIMGIYFGSSSLLFDLEEWSPLKQTSVHFALSLIIWLPLAVWMEWLSLKLFPVLAGIGSFIIVYLIFWLGSFLYFKKLENEMNNTMKK